MHHRDIHKEEKRGKISLKLIEKRGSIERKKLVVAFYSRVCSLVYRVARSLETYERI